MPGKLVKFLVPSILLVILLVESLAISSAFFTVGVENSWASTCYYILKTKNVKFAPDHPPLGCIPFVPLLFYGIDNKLTEAGYWNAHTINELVDTFGDATWRDIAKYTYLGRLFSVFYTVLLGFLVFWWSKKLFGWLAGTFSLFLYTFESTILANAGISYNDTIFALVMTLLLFVFRDWLDRPNLKNTILSGSVLFLVMFAKLTGLFLVGILFLLLIIFILQKQNKIPIRKYFFWFAGIILIAIMLLNAGYLFDGTFAPISAIENMVAQKEILHERISQLPGFIQWGYNCVRIPLPLPYIKGILSVLYDTSVQVVYLCGKYAPRFASFYLLSFLLKTSIPLLIFIGSTIAFWLIMLKKDIKLKKESTFNGIYFLLPVVIFAFIFTFFIKQLGLRYILAIYPLLLVFCGLLLQKPKNLKKPIIIAGIILLLAWHAYSALSIIPNNISYFNELIGGPKNGYKYFIDSNVDWGQNFGDLITYLQKNNDTNIRVKYWGQNDLNRYMPGYLGVPDHCEPGLIILSVTNWYDKEYRWLQNYKPIGQIKYSILIYNITSCK
jgi:hypothetical protein